MTREEALETLWNRCDHNDKTYEAYCVLAEQTRWIPVSENYPKINDVYEKFLVIDADGEMSVQTFFVTLMGCQPYFSGGRDVVAWMPLPKPYRAESEENDGNKT